VWDTRPRGDVPLDPADIVAGLVRTQLRELDAVTLVARPVLAGEQPAQAAADRQLERAERFLRKRAGARTVG